MAVRRPSGFPAFTVLWLGQLLSAVGTRMTNFALSLWVWHETGRAFNLALLMFASFAATALLSPVAGSLIDRLSRRVTIVLSDLGSAAVTFVLVAVFLAGTPSVWFLYAVNLLTGAFLAFQLPAYSATISLMMEKGNYPRANAMLSLIRFGPGIFAPSLATVLLAATDIKVVLLVDALSYLVAIALVFAVVLPATPSQETTEKPGMWHDSLFGFRYLAGRPALLVLEGIVFAISLFAAMGYLMLVPLILARTGSDTDAGLVLSIGAVGGVVGAVVLGALKSTDNKVSRMLLAIVVFSIFGRILFGVADSVVLWAVAMFVTHLCIPFIDGYSTSVFQEQVEPSVQGRVFAARQFIETMAVPLGLLAAGPAADRFFEPQMRPGGALAGAFGGLVGTGPGAGMGLVCVLVGVLGIAVAVAGFARRDVREIERRTPEPDAPVAEPVLVTT